MSSLTVAALILLKYNFMEKNNIPRKFKAYLPMIALFLLIVFLMPRTSSFSYDYKKGSPWMYETLVAQFDFPVLKTDSQMMEEREKVGSSIIPYYRLDPRVSQSVQNSLAGMDLGDLSACRSDISEALSAIYSKGILSASNEEEANRNVSGLIYLQKDRRAVKIPVSEVYTIDEAKNVLREAVSSIRTDADTLLSSAGLYGILAPDLMYDQQTTELVHDESVDNISRTQGVVRAGQVIVSQGEIITSEIEQLLDSYKVEYDQNVGYDGNVAFLWIGNILIAFSLVLVLFLAIYYCNYRIFGEFNKYLYLLLIFAISALASSLVSRTDPSLFYLTPFTLVVLYLLAFFKKRMVFSVYFISLLPMLLFAPDGVELFVMYLVAGTVGMFVFEYFNRGWLQFVTAFIVFVVMLLVWLAFRMAEGMDGINDYHTVVNMALGALLSVAGYPLIYLFEKIFRLVSTSKLVELSDTSNKLLRELADKAPGTFQHSLQVMNLADAAARSIGANVPLVRAGALYHDIGKIANPQCFTENETPGVKYHAELSSKESAQEIIRHVSDGLAMAEKNGLPQVLKDFIVTHHGTTCTGYFYNRYINDGGDPDDVADFFYDGVKPTSKEQVILMICDAVEAASRSLKDYSEPSISSLVDRIIDGKAEDGQLSNSDISLRELNIMKEEIKSYLQQMYHSRVVYPKRKGKASK